eukprot:2799538-Pyramimonas_sp.AAC.1
MRIRSAIIFGPLGGIAIDPGPQGLGLGGGGGGEKLGMHGRTFCTETAVAPHAGAVERPRHSRSAAHCQLKKSKSTDEHATS